MGEVVKGDRGHAAERSGADGPAPRARRPTSSTAGGGARLHPYSDAEITRGSYVDNGSEYMPYFEVKPK